MPKSRARPRQCDLTLPLLTVLQNVPTGLRASAAVAAVADHLNLTDDQRNEVVELSSGTYRAFDRDVRWARQRARLAGLVDGSVRNLWRLTPQGKRDLRISVPGLVITVFETALGSALWSTAEAALGHIEDRSLQLIITSPPYPIQTAKTYQTRGDFGAHIDWLCGLAREFKRCLTRDGSLVLNLGDAWNPGSPTVNLYQERLLLRLVDDLGYHLAQRCHWHNPAALPSPAEWVTVQRVRLAQKVETLWWLSPSAHPKADNARSLVPYSAAMHRRIARGGERGAVRPSGHALSAGAFGRDNGGAIRSNLLTVPNTVSNSAYHRYCRERNYPVHPARFPAELDEPFVEIATEPGDTVADPFAGSGTVGAAAERLGRRWLMVEQSLTYLMGAAGRFVPTAFQTIP